MKITRTSPLTGQPNTLDLPIAQRSFRRWLEGEPGPRCFPRLDTTQREFIVTGFMPGEYEIFCGVAPLENCPPLARP